MVQLALSLSCCINCFVVYGILTFRFEWGDKHSSFFISSRNAGQVDCITSRIAERISYLNSRIPNKLRSASLYSALFSKQEHNMQQSSIEATRVSNEAVASVLSSFFVARGRKGLIFSLALLTLSNICSISLEKLLCNPLY